MVVQALLVVLGGLAGWEWLKARGATNAAAAAPPAGRAAVPPSQAAPEGVAASIPGHVIPTPPQFTRQQIEQEWRTAKAGEGRVWWKVLAGVPWPDATGLWRTRKGALYQFRDCGGNPIGQPGYMPLQYQAWLAAGVNCDGRPFPPQSVPGNMAPILATAQPGAAAPGSSAAALANINQIMGGQAQALANYAAAQGGGGGVDAGQAVQIGATVVGTAATVAGAVATAAGATTAATAAGVVGGVAAAAGGGGAAAAGAVAAGIGAALACLGPIPAFLMPARVSGYAVDHGVRHASWIKSEAMTLLVDEGNRSLGVNVARVWGDVGGKVRYSVAAIEVSSVDTLRFLGVAGALAAMYDDHAHTIVGVFDEIESAQRAAEIYAAEWQDRKPTLVPCSCGPIAAAEEPLS